MNGLAIGKAAIAACGPNIGVGLGPNFAHIDVRGYAEAWPYAKVSPSWVKEIKDYQKAKGGSRRPIRATPTRATPKPSNELVRFAQRVLNAVEGERLDADGILGLGTRGALERFRKKHNLGAGGVLDDKTSLALAQRALEEIAQQSMFAQPGVLDAKSEQALKAFKSERRLGFSATLDAATRTALADSLARRAAVPSTPAPVLIPSGIPKLGAGLTPPVDPSAYRKFRLTTYHVVDQHEAPTGAVRVPIYDASGRKIAEGSPTFFAQLSLEGTARLTHGRLINVTGKTIPVSHDEYAEVLAYHRQAYARRDQKRREEGRKPTPTTYSGIVIENGRVVRALAFHEVPASRRGIGYGLLRGIPLVPFRTLAADIGAKANHDKDWKGKGGLVPAGTQVYIREYDGLGLPGGTTHDGWFIVNDTGGGIFGAHFDVFVGSQGLRKQVKLPAFGQVWFAGIERRIPAGYSYGLRA
jgi:peptidoglycan hydrolase-like protein with peptidoglycan-binding domain